MSSPRALGTPQGRGAHGDDAPSAGARAADRNESGLPGFEVGVWYGFAVPAAAPRPVVQKLNAEIAKALRDPKVGERLEQLGLAVVADSPEHFAAFVAAESEKMRRLVQVSGARVD
jgi:tripartite-type tricarboxylate transporter receptor subunit TctC